MFHRGIELPEFAAFPLLETPEGRAALRDYFEGSWPIGREHDAGFLLDTVTWRANRDWGAQLGYDAAELDRVNRAAVAFAQELRTPRGRHGRTDPRRRRVGPRGDGYRRTR